MELTFNKEKCINLYCLQRKEKKDSSSLGVCVCEHTESNRHSLVHPSKIIAPIYQGGRKGIHSRTHEGTGGECVPVIPTVLGWEECVVVGCML